LLGRVGASHTQPATRNWQAKLEKKWEWGMGKRHREIGEMTDEMPIVYVVQGSMMPPKIQQCKANGWMIYDEEDEEDDRL